MWNPVNHKWLGQNVQLTSNHASAALLLVLVLCSSGVEPRQSEMVGATCATYPYNSAVAWFTVLVMNYTSTSNTLAHIMLV